MFNFKKSIFLKLLLVVLITGIFVHLLVGLFFGMMFSSRTKNMVEKNLKSYADYIIKDIGIPPDTIKAREISDRLNIDIRYESKDNVWSTSKKLPAIAELEKKYIQRHFRFKPLWLQHVIITNSDGSRFLFKGNFGRWMNMYRELFFVMIILLSFVLIAAYFFMHRILKPIRRLTEGVNLIGLGDFNTQIPVKHPDEIGRLGEAFNNMAHKIKDMLKRREQLLLDVSHELRSPLTRMKIALEFLPEGKSKKLIMADLSDIEKMVTEILETERLQEGFSKLNLQDHDIIQIIRNVILDLKGKKPGIVFDSPNKELKIKIDAERIRIVLRNILENAIKFSKPESKPVRIVIIEIGNNLLIRIKDDGIGIPEAELENIFEPFYRVEKSRSKKTGGYGLGLALVKKIMEAHGGDIDVFNNKEGGVTVELKFIAD